MADEKILYEYERSETEDTKDEFRISCNPRSVQVFRRKGYDYRTEKEIFKHIITLSEFDGFGITIKCDNKDIYGGSSGFSFSSSAFKKISISIDDEYDTYISVKLEFK